MTRRLGSLGFGLVLLASVAVPANADDGEMRSRVEQRFSKAGLDENAEIAVEVEDGIVRLTGIAPTLRDARRADREARKVSDTVINEIRVFPEETRTDPAILKDAREAVLTYARYGVFDAVGLEVEDGVVMIHGFVRDSVRRREIEDRVARVEGVRDVHNDLRLQGASTYDEELRLRLLARIYEDPLFARYASWPEPPVRIFVERGRVTLAGTVSSTVEQTALGFIANEGLAFSVDNIVQVEGSVPEEDRPRDEG